MNIWESHFPMVRRELVKRHHKVAVLDQVEFSSSKESEVIRREVTQVLTSGTYVDELDTDYN
jgi:DNA mismatch repair ATPase MutS